MKRMILMGALLIVLCFPVKAMELSPWETQHLNSLKELDNAETFSFYDIAQMLLEQPEELSSNQLPQKIAELLLKEVKESAKLLSGMLLPILLFGILQASQLRKQGVSDTAFLVCYAVVAGLCITLFYTVADLAQRTIVTLDSTIKGLIPILFAVIAAGGGLTQASVVQPTIFMISQLLVTLIHHFLFPMILFAFALHIANHFAETVNLKLFGDMIHKTIKWLLIFALTIFVGILSIQSVAVTSMDAVKLKGARYAVNTLVPVVGGALAESLEAIGGSVMLIKNTMGLAGVIGIVLLCAVPVIRIFMITFLLRLTAAISQPAGDARFCNLLNKVAESTLLLGLCVLCLGVVFIFAIAVTIGTANTVFML